MFEEQRSFEHLEFKSRQPKPTDTMRLSKQSNRLLWNLTKHVIQTQSQKNTSNIVSLVPHEQSRNYSKGKDCGQANLLRMHALPLEESLARFLASVKPLLTAKEFQKQCQITEDFQKGEGQELQKLLEDVAEKERNWLAPRWLKVAYLQYRDPVTVYSSPGMTFPLVSFDSREDYLAYTAKIIFGLGEFKQMVDANKIPIVKMGKHPLDNGQFGKVMGTCRLPLPKEDCLSYNPDSNFVVVMHKNHCYKVPIFNKNCELYKSEKIACVLAQIMDTTTDEADPYGLLTTDKRDNWAESYKAVMAIKGNDKALEMMKECLFTVSLDKCFSYKKEDRYKELILQLIHGGGSLLNGSNRWMDKTIQLVTNQNGMIGFTYEHSPAEGQPIAMMMDYVVMMINKDKNYGCNGADEDPCPEKLPFAEFNDCLETWAAIAEKNLNNLVVNLEKEVLIFCNYGKNFIKTQKLGPDSFTQMAIQYAFFIVHGIPGAHYESAHLRIFDGGRTETIRSCSIESFEFCQAMTCPNMEDADKAKFLRKAVNAHQAYTKLALFGRGCDRHLTGLKLMALENCIPIPEFFSSLGYTKSTHFRVSTSQVATNYSAFMGYGPTCEDGYGVCYNPRKDDIIFSISAWQTNMNTSAVSFAKALEKALTDMFKILGGVQCGKPVCKL